MNERADDNAKTLAAHPGTFPRVPRLGPHAVLGLGALLVLAAEWAYRRPGSVVWLLLEGLIAGAALLYAWRTQDRLRLAPVLALALAFHAAWIALHFGLDVTGDKDSSVVYRWQGNGLVNGNYPRSEYPLGAVLLFAFEAWVGGGSTKAANAILMIPFQLATVAAIWATRTTYAPWLAAFVALWPLNAFSWEFKFDLVPAALLAVGAVLAWRNRWALSGVVLGLGALVKWTPGLTAVVLVAWLLASRRGRDALVHAGSFVAVVALAYVPFLAWNADHVLAAYTRQSGRSITPESMWYLLLRPFDLARVRTHLSFAAGAPEWADALAVVVQVALLLALVLCAVFVRGRLRVAVALAVLAPAVFLLTNRIFSPQFVIVLFASWLVAGALVVRSRREQLAVGVAAALVSACNAFVYPFALPHYAETWVICSAVLFAVALGLTAWLALSAGSAPETEPRSP